MRPPEILAIPLLALAASTACTGSEPPALGDAEYELAIIPRGSTCAQLGLGNQSLTLQSPTTGTYSIDGSNSVDLTYYDDTSTIFYFNHATIRMTGVLVSIGDRTLMWDMPGGADAWPSLHGPPDVETGEINPPEEVTFCFDYSVRIQPSPYAHNAQLQSWSITKTGRSDALVLSENQAELVEYDVTVAPATATATGQFIEGPVFVVNTSPHSLTVDAVTTMVGDLAATVTCPDAAPFTMAPWALTTCTFHADVPDTTDRNVVGGGTVSHGVLVTTQEVVASFAVHNVTTTTTDDCITVSDEGVELGTTCTADGEVTFNLSSEIGPFACGDFAVTTTASYQGVDTGASADATWTVRGEVVCNPGCTLSQHYWKVHSDVGPRRFHPTWNLLGPDGENTPFFQSGGTYVETLWRRALGNPYWTLAKAYVAARLNRLNGAQFTSGTLTAFNNATELLSANSPTRVAGNQALRKSIVKAAAALKDFNSGRTGPGKCTCKPDLDEED